MLIVSSETAISGPRKSDGRGAADFARRVLGRFTGSEERGDHLVTLTAATIRGVAVGVVGVAVIQSLLLAVGFFAIGLPAAGLWTGVVLLLCFGQGAVVLVTPA